MLRPTLLAAILLACLPASAQTPGVPPHARGVLDGFAEAGSRPTPAERAAATDALWSALAGASRLPYAAADTALFLWRGTAASLAVAGDHTGWQPSQPLARIPGTDVWVAQAQFDPAARVDYKLVVGGSWVLDPNNPHQQWSGFGPNSELRMPAWTLAPETVYNPTIAHGTLGAAQTLQSARYGAPVVYRVWTPAGYDAPGAPLADLPVVYVTDGHEYADARLGALPTVLDNRIADGTLPPCLAVFIDPRWQGQNRRQEQYVQNEGFAAFVADELVPAIDAAYRTRPHRDARVILGTSLGGLFSAYLGVRHPDTFGRLAIQSPAFWVSENPQMWTGPSIYALVGAAPGPFGIAMTTGTIRDTQDGARRMRDVLLAQGRPLTYREVPEGHSWGNWRALLDDVLAPLLATGTTDTPEPATDGETGLRLDVRPNPASGTAHLAFAMAQPGSATLTCTDTLGRTVATLADGALPAGPHVRTLQGLAPGRYACRLVQAGGQAATASVTLLR